MIINSGVFEEIKFNDEHFFRVVSGDNKTAWVLIETLPENYQKYLEEKYNNKCKSILE